ncbi:hypothetical protein QJS04_geneDACA022532 [Acorus gramineus]|uniref:Katanin p80 WD40 repeat-containing subunit B1 homolog n=1 Tax=Acorus gramineus TaxID=55184 RepID=A0AAV9A8R2_ACOGR|nr:hypothetical protein QJS04_geneDACA022532 [Acorus gramineus]
MSFSLTCWIIEEFVAHASSNVNCLSIGKKSRRVFVTGGDDRKVNLWAVGRTTPLLCLSGHTSSVKSVTYDSEEVLVVAGASSGTIKLWDLEQSKNVRTLTGHRAKCSSVEFHPFGEFFASGSSDTDLKIWDIRKKACIHTYNGHSRGITTIRFTPDGRWVVSCGEDNVVKVWDLTAGRLLHDFKSHGVVQCIDFHPHEFLMATGSADRVVQFWDLETFELIGSSGSEASGVRSVSFHPDGRTLFCGLDESLKVFSWEPIRCHDAVDMGWSHLGDLCIHEGQLLGCSYHQSRVAIWIADISLIGPYASGIIPRSNNNMDPESNNGENVAVVQGRTRSLVESWERRERCKSSEAVAFSSPNNTILESVNMPSTVRGCLQTSERSGTDSEHGIEIVMQNHESFLSVLNSRFTKLQVTGCLVGYMLLYLENNCKIIKYEMQVQVDLISILMEKIDTISLDVFTCLLPLLRGLLDSNIERHINVSLEMLLKLVKIFGPVISSTTSASSVVGVDLQAERRYLFFFYLADASYTRFRWLYFFFNRLNLNVRRALCNQCFSQLQNIKKILQSLIR